MGYLATLRAVGLALGLGLMLSAIAPASAPAQNLFETVATVNGQAINRYQVQQRALFFQLLRAPNPTFDGAREALVNETLQTQAARAAGVEVTPEELDAGMVEFAARGNLEPEQLLQLFAQAGVAPETFRDFVRNGLYWRSFVQLRFGPLAQPTEAEIERAVADGGFTAAGGAATRVLLSEIVLPVTADTQTEVQSLAQRLANELTGPEDFQQAARRFSRAPSAQRGGRRDFITLAELPPQVASQVVTLSPGQITQPINLGTFIGLFLLRDIQQSSGSTTTTLSVDYAQVFLPGGRTDANLSRAAQLRRDSDTCDDLYGTASGLSLDRQVRPTADLPVDLRQALDALDDGEATTLAGGDVLRFVMLCGRVTEIPPGAFEQVGQQLLGQRLGSYADNFLQELRADAIITGL